MASRLNRLFPHFRVDFFVVRIAQNFIVKPVSLNVFFDIHWQYFMAVRVAFAAYEEASDRLGSIFVYFLNPKVVYVLERRLVG